MNIQGKGKESVTYDAIVVGSGISGGWAAKELTEKGLKVLMIERGRELKHIEGYDTAMKESFDFPHRNRLTEQMKKDYWAGIRTGYTITEATKDLFVKDSEDPYEETQRFDWMRAYHTGGKSLHWGRQTYRWNERDFTANGEEGVGVDWPIRYKDIEPWYSYVEKFAGISGEKRGLDVLPDSHFQPAMELNCVEREVRKGIESKFKGRYLTIGRVAHLTNPTEEQLALGRTSCQYRNKCIKGCPYGAYFSTQAATLPAAEKTNNLTLVNDKIVYEVIFDDEKKKAIGVRTIDRNTKKTEEFYSKVIFLNAGAMGTAWILMQSKSKTHPNGLGNESDQLGRNIMDHHLGVGASGSWEGFEDMYFYGKRPNGVYIPRFANWGSDKRDFLRGFGYQGGGSRGNKGAGDLIGAELKATYTHLGGWGFGIGGFGETLPDPRNRFTLSQNKDQWGLPIINFDAAWRENEMKMRVAMESEAANMLEAAGLKNVRSYNDKEKAPGIGIHEMGTARMGRDPKTSVLNGNNQVWGAENVYVTDGACMVSSSCVNPSLTYMALTARAADHAVNELKKQNI
ncbi:GMC oxidoreductase [Leadbetterella sp. DM7]|uniref:GMC oxidoreductase n=1 Tax=Leadbetterella sp. DM7 TaxID=3235085 RepID=UPI00349EBBDC